MARRFREYPFGSQLPRANEKNFRNCFGTAGSDTRAGGTGKKKAILVIAWCDNQNGGGESDECERMVRAFRGPGAQAAAV